MSIGQKAIVNVAGFLVAFTAFQASLDEVHEIVQSPSARSTEIDRFMVVGSAAILDNSATAVTGGLTITFARGK